MAKTIYIAGPITGLPREEYMGAFKYWENTLKRYEPNSIILNPAEKNDNLEGLGLTHEQFITICKGMIDACDEVYFMPGYEKSEGARAEFHHAKEKGITRCLITIQVSSEKGEKE